ncbi:serine/threonine-protein kinase [Actinomycetospora soli]|uniref:serine/threonine-protein kinase n=1 Tax=Actinomycetospora soli TaxID=2893887 RepID=UPI001E60CF99|nr:protein kinase [Actinomycetospora soli]MCD2187851.1 protein kinase [Actinomycetospora soli]
MTTEAGRTRREALEDHGPPTTRREPKDVPGPPATRREADGGPTATRHEDAQAVVALPADLAERFPEAALLPTHGAEADVFRVDGPDGTARALKLYRRGITPDARVAALLTDIRHPHVVRTFEVGVSAAGLHWELMEFLPHGSLRDLLTGGGPARPEPAETVRQIAAGLLQLHDREIVHRDLKPDNVLVRSVAPLELVLTDFGLSRDVSRGTVYSSQARSVFYAAPESFQGAVDESRDWWSLGIVVREFSGRTPLFGGLDERQILHELLFRPIETDSIDDPRLQLLARGLLVKDPGDRWGSDQVTSWLDGGSPAVARDAGAAPGVGFEFDGATFHDPAELARAMAANWREAARMFVAVTNTLRDDLLNWGTSAGLDIGAKRRLVAQLDQERPDLNLLLTLTWLDPDLPAVYLGRSMSAPELREIALQAAESPRADQHGLTDEQMLLDDLCRGRVLDVLAGMPTGDGLHGVSRRWFDGIGEWERIRSTEAPAHAMASLHDASAVRRARARLLAAALTPDASRAALRHRLTTAEAELARPVSWFSALARRSQTSAAMLIALDTLPVATAEADQHLAEERAAYAAAQERRRQWDAREQRRAAGRDKAVGLALLGLAVPILACTTLFRLGVGGVLIFALAAGVQLAAELWLASRLGGDYSPGYTLFRRAGIVAGPFGRFLQMHAVIGLLVLAVTIGLGVALAVQLPVVFALVVTAGIVFGAWHAHRHWQRWLADTEIAVLGWQP